MSLEGAAALEVLFSGRESSSDDIGKRLELFNRLRLPRNNVTLLLFDGILYQDLPTDVSTPSRSYHHRRSTRMILLVYPRVQ